MGHGYPGGPEIYTGLLLCEMGGRGNIFMAQEFPDMPVV